MSPLWNLSTFLLLAFAAMTHAAKILLPSVTGPYSVGAYDLILTDQSRTDPFAPSPTPRSIAVSLFYPASKTSGYPTSPYMSPLTAAFHEKEFNLPHGTVSSIVTNSRYGAPIKNAAVKVILFSTGLGTSRSVYTVLAEDLASQGYLVACIDNPYDAPIVEFPDGRVVYSTVSANLTDEIIERYYNVRVKDALFTLASLRKLPAGKAIPGARGLRVKRVGIFGHSIGGATAAGAMSLDSSILGGVNLDGTFFGSPAKTGVKKPFVLFGATRHNRTTDKTWGSFWEASKGWKRELSLKGSGHLSFSDFPPLVDLLGFRPGIPKEVEEFIGTIAGLKAVALQRVYLKSFFDRVLRDKDDGLYDGPDARYPEVLFL